jgi:protein-disulfide isomerase
MSRNRLLLLVGVCSTAVAAALVTFSLAGGSSSRSPARHEAVGVFEATSLLAGIPQHGSALGRPYAPVTLVEYADLQCPYCGLWARETFPQLVREYVRPGKVRIVFRGLAFVGQDSATGLATALAAARQNRLWHVVDLLYANQGRENSGWLDERLIRDLGAQVPGLDVERMLSERSSTGVADAAVESQQAARDAGVTGTPSFQIGRTGGTLRPLRLSALDASAFRSALNSALSS